MLRFLNRIFRFLIGKLLSFICNILQIKKGKIVFSNFNGRGWGDNPKYIAQEILHQNLPFDLVWLVSNTNEYMPASIRKVRFGSLRMKYELSTAHIIINNVKNDLPYRKKKKQYYIQTWHGGFALKYIEREVEEKLSSFYVADSKRDSLKTDLMLAACSIDYLIMQNYFWYNGEIFRKGIPRNDIYFKNEPGVIEKVRLYLHVPPNHHLVLYAPTFRNSEDTSMFNLNVQKVIEALRERFGGEWSVVIRMHPNVSRLANRFQYSNNIIDGSQYPDVQELSVAVDSLITDYSSMIYDFMIMKKPVFLYASDLEEYTKERGLRSIFYKLPFTLCQTNDELLDAIQYFDDKEYLNDLSQFWCQEVKSFDTGHASEAVVGRIIEVVNGTFYRNLS